MTTTTITRKIEYVGGKAFRVVCVYQDGKLIEKAYHKIRK